MRINDFVAWTPEEIEKRKVRALVNILIGSKLKDEIRKLEVRAKQITKRETKKIEEVLNSISGISEFGEVNVRYGGKLSWSTMDISLSVSDAVKPKINHAWNIDLFEIMFSYDSDRTPWLTKHLDRDLDARIENDQKFLSAYDSISQDYSKIPAILSAREKLLNEAEQKANEIIPEHLRLVLHSKGY